MRNPSLVAVALAALFVHTGTGITHAEKPAIASSANAGLRAVLAQKVTLRADKTPLREVLAILARQIHVKIDFDQGALSDAGIDPAAPVTFDRTDVSARSALEAVLRNLRLSWCIDDDVIRVTTSEQGRRTLETVVYDLTDLTRVEGKAEAKDGESEADTWCTLIGQTVSPDQWRDSGGLGMLKPFVVPGKVAVVVTQTSPLHGRIEELLTQLHCIEAVKSKSPQAPWIASSSDKALVRRALQKKIDLKFQKVPLRQAMESFGRLVQLGIEFDEQSITGAGVAMDAPITYERSGGSGRTALEAMLRSVGLTWLPLEGSILIVSSDEAANHTEFAAYDVTDLVERPKDEDASNDSESLIEAINEIGGPNWPSGTGPLQGLNMLTLPHAQVLVVAQVPTVQEELASFFAQIRAITASRSKLGPTAAPIASAPATGKMAMLRALEKKISLRLKDVPLQRAIEQVGRELGRSIELDKRSLDEAGTSLDTPVTYRGTKVSARVVLDAILDEPGLSWVAEEDLVWITTHDEATNRLEVVVYDVTDLVAGKDKDAKAKAAKKKADPNKDADEEDTDDDQSDTLVEALRASIRPDSWSETGGTGSASVLRLSQATILMVSQTQRIQDEVADCLSSFRRAAAENHRGK